MFILALLAARGPIAALTILVSTATFSAGAFFVALRNTALDCPRHYATNAACGVHILTDLVTFIAAAGATAGATFIGLTSPTPPFSVSTVLITIDNPAVVEWQFNHTSPIQKYITYEKDGYLHKRLDTGVDIPDPSGKRALCRALLNSHASNLLVFVVEDMEGFCNNKIAQFNASSADNAHSSAASIQT
ncbi:hypothetical protein Focb16_v000088 [Fusarium oxysporum f. sp. cubense]|uniref:Uncharacterized protein n=1 Tax=Fusarium oxysporum f. sp. cubense TaxID=61366 RepID=A0A559LAX1_FUSOC|nr:hypothetical protein Focb16_v000088 [Fusarium oxysporum f. sp. cubense]